MTNSSAPADREQELLKHARREGLVILLVWAIALIWSVSVSYLWGYNRPAAEILLILGIPDWVFWSVFVPWGLAFIFSIWFCFAFIADDDLGKDPEDDTGHG
jgi:hypothetical protein